MQPLSGQLAVPKASLARGGSGVALFLAEAARHFQEPLYVEAAERWLASARVLARSKEVGFGPAALDAACGLHDGVYSGRAGLAWAQLFVAEAGGNARSRRQAVASFARDWKAAEVRKWPWMMSGAAGFAEAAYDALALVSGLTDEEQASLRGVGRQAADIVLEALEAEPRKGALGIAFGDAGLLLAALRWDPHSSRVTKRLDHIATLLTPNDSVELWPRIYGSPLDVAGLTWCNGSTGVMRLFVRAHEVLGERRWLAIARRAVITLASMRAENPTLCCGIAGEALAMHDFARQAGTKTLAKFVRSYMRAAMSRAPELPMNLLTGRIGIAWAGLAVAAPSARRPLAMR